MAVRDLPVPSVALVAFNVSTSDYPPLHRQGAFYNRRLALDSLWEEALIFHSVDLELAAINRRLDYMTELLCQAPTQHLQTTGDGPAEQEEINDEEESPFKLLGTQRVMSILGLDANFAQELVRLERTALPKTGTASSRLYMVTHQQALT